MPRATRAASALALDKAGRPFVLGLPHLLDTDVHTPPAFLGWGNLGDLPTAPPQHPVVTQLAPARGDGSGAETLVAVHGKHDQKDIAERLSRCDSLNRKF